MGSSRAQSSATSLPERPLGNLPLELTSFVGRDREVAEVERLLAGRRLLTLCGPGGAGKTRLALAVAQDVVEEFEGGVWWVELAPLSDPNLVARTVASSLGVTEAPDLSPTESLVEHLERQGTLLILDNCEHLVEACADLAETLLRACPKLRILATSREPLRVAGESSWQVPSLSLPDLARPTPAGELAGYEAVNLFVERARAVDAGFELTEGNAAAVALLCRKLDGIPLAIELAAARSRVLSAEQISEKLEDPLGFLTTGDRSAAPRQRTLRATLEWSHGLLGEAERVLFRRLSVFVGGWDLEAAEAVWGGQPAHAGLVLDLLSALVDKSLVVAEAGAGGALRYGMLEPVRQFGLEKLREIGEEAEIRRRHAKHYLALAEAAEPELLGPDQERWLQRLRTELGNLRSAREWSLESDLEERPEVRMRLVAALGRFWGIEGFEEGKWWLEVALESDPGGFPVARAKALAELGFILSFQQSYGPAIAALDEAVTLYKQIDDRSGAAFALANLGWAVLHGYYRERLLDFLGESEALLEEGLDGHPRAYLSIIRAVATLWQGDLDLATSRLEEAISMCRELGSLRDVAMAIFNLGGIHLRRDDTDRAIEAFEEGARISLQLGDLLGSAYYVWIFGDVNARLGNPARAARLWGAAEALREQMGMSFSRYDLAESGYQGDLAAVRSTLDDATFDAAWNEGRAMSPDQAIEYALEGLTSPPEVVPADRSSAADPTPERRGREGTEGALNNLPAARSGFVGRDREMYELGRALSTTRLLTLTGAGGCGKTTLALEVARDLADAGADSYPDGVWLVELASISQGDLVPGAVAAALGLLEQPDQTYTDLLVDFLRSKRMLLVLDNCEHLIEDCARLVDTLLGSCENLRVMATSREALGVPGEVNWIVPSLTVPDSKLEAAPEALARYESVELFVERARSRVPGFDLTQENVDAVADICRKLDGIPLAIELATARMGTLSVEQISERLGDSLGFLTTGDRTRAPRQRTLRAALEWGFELLSEPERELFGRLSVFVGGWTLEAAEAVGASGSIGTEDVLNLLAGLVEKSLVVAEDDAEGVPRYRMLETVRQYGREQLHETETIRARHAAFFLALAEQATPGLRGPGQISWLRKLDAEQGNLRAAIAWSLAGDELEKCARLGWALWLFWWIRGRFAEGRRWMEDALARGGAASVRAKELFVAGTMACGQADWQVASDMLEESLGIFRRLGDNTGASYALSSAGFAAIGQGRQQEGIALLEEAVDLSLQVGEKWGAAFMLSFLATVRRNEGDHTRATELADQGLTLAREVEDREGTSVALYILAGLAHAAGDNARAREYFEEALHLSAELGDQTNVAYCLEGLAAVAASKGNLERAARLWGATEVLLESIEAAAYVYAPDRNMHEDQVEAARADLGQEAFAAAWARGREMSSVKAIDYALHEPAESSEADPESTSARHPLEVSEQATFEGRPNNLPTARGSLVGREREIAEVEQALTSTRLLTLTGAGGCGKTRLALEVARKFAGERRDENADGVWFVGLASLTEGELVPGAVASVLGVREQPDVSVTDSLVQFLRERRMLLVLDNCEHLIEECAGLVNTLLSGCENLRVMATSREALGITDELNWVVPSLTVPAEGVMPDTESLIRYESVELFVERARSRVPGFDLTQENVDAVADICRKLDGIPLAIELATARMGTLSVEQISERLGDSLGFLTTGDRTRAPRQRTLRAALEWGFELLSEPERELFGRLSVFVGGWTLEAAEVVGASGSIETEYVLDLLSRLVQQSLVLAEMEAGENATRYRMLEPVRQYALERLERGGEAHDVRDRHAALFTALATQAHRELRGPNQVAWMQRLTQENDNLRAAITWELSSGDYESAALLGWALWPFWFYRGNQREGRRMVQKALEGEDRLTPDMRIKATLAVAVLAYGQGDNDGVSEYMSALLELSREVGGDSYAEAYARAGLGLVAMNRGDLVAATGQLEQALPLFLECGELWTASQTHTWLGTVQLLQGDHERAVARFEEGLALARWTGDRAATYNALYALGQVALVRGDHELATNSFREGVGLSKEMGDLANVAYCLEGLATVAGARAEAERSARLFGAARGLLETIGVPVWTFYKPDRSLYERTMADLRVRLGEAAFEAEFEQGRTMPPGRAIEYALEDAVPAQPFAEADGQPMVAPAQVEEDQERLRIFGFGPARVEKDGVAVDSPDWIHKSRELLYFLLSHSPRTKEQIGLALWPEASTAQLRSSFHDTVYRLRRALGGKEWIAFEKRRYAFDRSLSYSYDVETFEGNISEARRVQAEAPDTAIRYLQEAAGLYEGDFLEDFADSEWAMARQEELRRAYQEALLLLGELLYAAGRYAEGADAYRKAIAHDRFLEEAHRGLMRCQAGMGERSSALRHYDELVALLEEQLGAPPTPETTTLYRQLRGDR